MGEERDLVFQTKFGCIKGRAGEFGVSPELRLEFSDEANSNERFKTLSLPLFFSTFRDMSERKLSVNWENNKLYLMEAYSHLLEGLSTYLLLRYPGFWIITPIKNYTERAHGQLDRSTYQLLPVVCFLKEIKERALTLNQLSNEKWTGAVSNVIMIAPEPEFSYHLEKTPNFPENDGVPQMLIFPALDLDIDATGEPQKDLAETADLLAKNGFSGWLIQSGDPPKGGYHFLADFVMPYYPYMWQSLGRLMSILTFPENTNLVSLSKTIEKTKSLNEAQKIATKILNLEEIRKRSYPLSRVDLRFCAHQIEAGMTKLRVLKAKGYEDFPRVIGYIK